VKNNIEQQTGLMSSKKIPIIETITTTSTSDDTTGNYGYYLPDLNNTPWKTTDKDLWNYDSITTTTATQAMSEVKSKYGFTKIEISLVKNGIIVKTSERHPKTFKSYQDFVFKDFEAFKNWIDDNLSPPLEQTEFIEEL